MPDVDVSTMPVNAVEEGKWFAADSGLHLAGPLPGKGEYKRTCYRYAKGRFVPVKLAAAMQVQPVDPAVEVSVEGE